MSAIISVPPLIGWNDWSSQKLRDHCELSSERAFVVFSASGSFFLPLLVMVVVYVKIFLSARQRIRTNRDRSALTRIRNMSLEGIGKRKDTKRFSVDSVKVDEHIGEKTPLVQFGRSSILTVTDKVDATTKSMKYHNNCNTRHVNIKGSSPCLLNIIFYVFGIFINDFVNSFCVRIFSIEAQDLSIAHSALSVMRTIM
ncbi:hypothetical protein DICVIV_09225 [Dictyocaulus viviparus]|uniref:G-protein coupled receptors family 1 profile domain-containing protein n=1 Tax=Dictyocaulus viviparus TaxID=29172 RepID=A0A0D8XLS7_DICVI|nr:hypothetical protein DICVIV_09225 [Dictyocaulus viviparus]